MRKVFVLLCIVFILIGCSPKITSSFTSYHTPLAKDAEVLVLEIDVPMPENAEVLGQIKIGDTGFTTKNGNYAAVLNIARDQARQAGGASAFVGAYVGAGMAAAGIGGFYAGAITGGAAGATAGFINGFGMSTLETGNPLYGFNQGIYQAVVGAGIGALVGGMIQGLASCSQGNDFWNGKPVSETVIPESEYFTYPQKKDMT